MKNRSHRKFGSILSEIISSDVIHSILSNPTDTLQALNESDLNAKIRNNTQSAKNKLKKFYNGDFLVRYEGTFAQIRQDLRKLLSLNLEGRSAYAVYETPNGKLAFRLTDHNANGNNFEQDDAELNISVYIAFEEFDHIDCTIHYKEYKIMPEVFNTNRAKCINSIINGVYNALYGGEFDIDNSIAEMTEYNKPIKADSISDNDNNQLNCNKHMNKNTIRLTESQLSSLIKKCVVDVLSEGRHYYYPRTYQREEEKVITTKELLDLCQILENEPIEEMWAPVTIGDCKVQRVPPSHDICSSHYVLGAGKNGTEHLESDGGNGVVVLTVGRMPNANPRDEVKYMVWKWQ